MDWRDNEGCREFIGCFGTVVILMVVGSALSFCSDLIDRSGLLKEDEETSEVQIIPSRFQGAYNSIGCGSASYIDGRVMIGGDTVFFPVGSIAVKEVVSQSDTRITFRGSPGTSAGVERDETFTLTYAAVGDTAYLDGDEYLRCSQYDGN